MGIRVVCPNGHRLHLKAALAGHRGLCPDCNARFRIPFESSDLPQPFADPPTRTESRSVRPTGASRQDSELTTSTAVDRPRRPTARPRAKESAFHEEIAAGQGGIGHPRVVVAETPRSSLPAAQPVDVSPTNGSAATPLIQDDRESVWYVQPPDGEQYGPATRTILQTWIEEGRVTADCLVWRDGWPAWRSALEILPGLVPTAAPELSPASFIEAQEELPPRVVRRRWSNRSMALLILAMMIGLLAVAGIFVLLQNNGLSFGPTTN